MCVCARAAAAFHTDTDSRYFGEADFHTGSRLRACGGGKWWLVVSGVAAGGAGGRWWLLLMMLDGDSIVVVAMLMEWQW